MNIERKAARRAFTATVEVREPGARPQNLTVLDVSEFGCRVALVNRVKFDTRVFVRFPGLEAIPAYVCWCEHFEAGLEFEKAIHPAVLGHLLSRVG
jgi:hypothetical protein